MLTNPKARLLADVFSHIKKTKQYGSRLDIVTVISDHDGVLIVQGKNKERFTVRKETVQIL